MKHKNDSEYNSDQNATPNQVRKSYDYYEAGDDGIKKQFLLEAGSITVW